MRAEMSRTARRSHSKAEAAAVMSQDNKSRHPKPRNADRRRVTLRMTRREKESMMRKAPRPRGGKPVGATGKEEVRAEKMTSVGTKEM